MPFFKSKRGMQKRDQPFESLGLLFKPDSCLEAVKANSFRYREREREESTWNAVERSEFIQNTEKSDPLVGSFKKLKILKLNRIENGLKLSDSMIFWVWMTRS